MPEIRVPFEVDVPKPPSLRARVSHWLWCRLSASPKLGAKLTRRQATWNRFLYRVRIRHIDTKDLIVQAMARQFAEDFDKMILEDESGPEEDR